MDKLIKSGFIEIDEVFVVGNKELREENASSSETLHKITANTENVEDGEEKEVKIKIEKLEQLKIRLQNETQEMNRNATELSNEIISRANLDAKKIIDDAKKQADSKIEEAQKYVDEKIQDSEITKLAQENARAIQEEAIMTSQQIKEGARNYAIEMLTKLNSNIEKINSRIDKNIKELEEYDL